MSRNPFRPAWAFAMPIAAAVLLAATLVIPLGATLVTVCAAMLIGAVLAAVHHAEVVAHRSASRSARWCSRSR